LAYEVPDFAAQVSIIASEVTLSVAVSGTANVNISGQSIDVKITNAVDASGNPIPLKIDISAQSLATLAVDIKAQSVGNIKVDLAAQSVGNLAVDIKAQSVGNLNVNLASVGTGVVLNVAQSGSWTVNAAQTGTWTINIGAPLDTSGNLKTSIQSSVTLNVNIASQSTTLNVNISSQSANVNISVAAQSVGVYLEPQWAAKQGTDVNIQGATSTTPGGVNDLVIVTYYVPTGKTLLIHSYGAASSDTALYPATVYLYNTTDNVVLGSVGGAGGAGIALTKPIRVESGKGVSLRMISYVYSSNTYFRGSFHGELI
jgi:hypothetical protein